MSAVTTWRSALFLAILMAIMGPLQMTGNLSVNSADIEVLKESKTISHSSTGSAEFLGLLGDDIANNAFTVDVPSDAPITDLQLTIEPSAMQTHYGFTWEGELAWDVPDSTMNGTVVEIGSLTGQLQGHFGILILDSKVGQFQIQPLSAIGQILVDLTVPLEAQLRLKLTTMHLTMQLHQ